MVGAGGRRRLCWTQVGTTYTRPTPSGPATGYSSVEATGVPFAPAGATYIVAQGTSDLMVVKTNNVSGATTVGSAWTWTLHVANGGTGNAVFGSGQTIVSDSLPNSSVSYGSASVANIGSGVTGSANISCSIASNDLTCVANGGPVTLGTNNGSFDVVFTATPTSAVYVHKPAQRRHLRRKQERGPERPRVAGRSSARAGFRSRRVPSRGRCPTARNA